MPTNECNVLDTPQEDERDAPPLQEVPEPFPIKCLEMTFGFGPCKLYRTLLKAGSSMIDNIAKVEGLENFTRSPWEMVEGEGGRPLRQRKITYRCDQKKRGKGSLETSTGEKKEATRIEREICGLDSYLAGSRCLSPLHLSGPTVRRFKR